MTAPQRNVNLKTTPKKTASPPCAVSTASTRGSSACCARPISTALIRSARRALLYEIAQRGAPTASEIGRALDLDAGYLSRTLRNFEKRGLIERKASASDARQSHLALSARGRKSFAPLERRSQRDAGATLARLGRTSEPADRGDEHHRRAARSALRRTIQVLTAAKLRAPKRGDFGWIVKRHAELYAQEYGWGAPFEGVCAQIVADFVNKHDRKRERCWIAEIDGEHAGTVMLVKGLGEGRPHSVASARAERARDWSRRTAGRRKHKFRASRRLPEDHAVDPQRTDRSAAHLSESRLQTHAHRAAPQLGPAGRQRALGFGYLAGNWD